MKDKTKGELHLVSNCWQGGDYYQITGFNSHCQPQSPKISDYSVPADAGREIMLDFCQQPRGDV